MTKSQTKWFNRQLLCLVNLGFLERVHVANEPRCMKFLKPFVINFHGDKGIVQFLIVLQIITYLIFEVILNA